MDRRPLALLLVGVVAGVVMAGAVVYSLGLSGRNTAGAFSLDTSIAMMFRGDYDPGSTYAAGDVVTFKGTAYVAGQETKEAPPNEPWLLFVEAGQGPEGPAGPQGPAGAQGAAGAKGDAGPRGADGASGPSAMIGRVEGAGLFQTCYPNCTGTQLNGMFKFAAPAGNSTYVGPVDEALVTQLSPAAQIVARDLFIKTTISGSNGDAATFTLRANGSATAVSCVMASTSKTNTVQTCTSGSASATIQPGSELSLEIRVKDSVYLKLPILFGWRAANP